MNPCHHFDNAGKGFGKGLEGAVLANTVGEASRER